MKKSRALMIVFVLLGGLLVLLFSFTVVYVVLIPDPCFYHTNVMGSFMSLFFSAGGADNGHPSPNIINLICSLLLGGALGYGSYRAFIKK